MHINRYLLEQSSKSEERLQVELEKLDAMVRYADTRRCLRQYILQYFGENAKDSCQGCSNCCEVRLGKPELQAMEEDLLNALRSLRLMLAIEEGVPSYRVMSDETLLELAKKQPVSVVALEQITGMGQRRIEQYGEAILNCIAEFQRM